MSGKCTLLLFTLTIGPQGSLFAQHPGSIQHQAEDLLYNEEAAEVPVEIFERYADLLVNQLNLNNATSDQLGESGLFSSFQVHTLIKYREKYGDLFSLYELAGLTGFSMARLKEIAPYLTLESGVQKTYSKKYQHLVIFNAGKVLPEAEGYENNMEPGKGAHFTGPPLKTDLRIKSILGRNLSLGITYEKDAGEPFFQRKKPEFLSGYLAYRGNRFLKLLVVGNFQLNHGMGLVSGDGFMHSPEGMNISRQSMLRLRPYSSKSESRFERGVGVQMDFNRFRALCWSSYRQMDMSTIGLTGKEGHLDWRNYFRETGLHRTAAESGGRDLAYRFHCGTQFLYGHKALNLGMMLGTEVVGLTRRGADSVGIQQDPILHNTLSLHGNLQKGGWQFFGEMAISNWKSKALLVGTSCQMNDFIKGLVLLHHYGAEYTGFQPSAYASGSRIIHETGIALHLLLEPGRLFTVNFTGELFRFPGPRYLTSVPSNGYRYGVTFENSGKKDLKWRIKIKKGRWQNTPEWEEIGLRPLQTSEVTRFDVRFIYDHLVTWQSRILVSLLSHGGRPLTGYAGIQQANFQPIHLLTATLQFVVFKVEVWENRLYLYEPGFYYNFSFCSLYGTGQKALVILTLKPFGKVTLAGKIAVTSFQDRMSVGSMYDLTKGNKRWEVGIQLRMNI